MLFNSTKEINRLLCKGMLNIYLKLTFEKNRHSQLQFSEFKKFVTRSVPAGLQLMQISLNFKTCCDFFYQFNFERNYDVLKSKSPCILLNKNINFNKNEMELKMENPT